MNEIINYGMSDLPINIEVIENKFSAQYICDMCLPTATGWSTTPAQIYWQEKPPADFSNYFGILINFKGELLITSAKALVDIDIPAIRVGDEILFSRYRHDFRLADNGASIDGGRDYVKTSGKIDEELILRFKGPQLVRHG